MEEEKLTRRERRQRWKEVRKKEREALKERLKYAPALRRWWILYLWKPAAVLLGVTVLVLALSGPVFSLWQSMISRYYFEVKDKPLSEEDIPKLYELSPLDDEGAKRIAAYPSAGADETWTICVYMVASDLEDRGENDLSRVTEMMTEEAVSTYREQSKERQLANLTRFTGELEENGLELPAFFFYPEKPVPYSNVVTEEVTVTDDPGSASADIGEMTAGTWSDNISIVIQTGGATRWSNRMVNPNRLQRFLYRGGVFSQVSDMPLASSSEPDTLADFLRFCRDEYPADHTMLVLWNHGGGPFGYGHDNIYQHMSSLKDIRQALSEVYTPDRNRPAFDIIGFDACLMSCIEVTNTLDGFAKFYCLSEEVEPGDGWDYTPFLQALTDDGTMSPARVAQNIADSYTDYYMRENINQFLVNMDVTFSVIDAGKAAELYDAYGDLCEKQLEDALKDPGVLAEIGRCAGRATHYAQSYYNIFNTVDLGNYMDYLGDSYPEECSRVKDLIGQAVLYHRENGALSDSTGIAVYVPVDVTTDDGLLSYLRYVYDICEDDRVAALYYYKQAGCLGGSMKETAARISDTKPAVLDVGAFRQFGRTEPVFDESGFLIPVSEELQNLIVDYELETSLYDESAGTLTCYGREDCLTLDGEGHLASDFDGRWICMDGQPLYLEIVSSAPAAVEYRSHVLYNGKEAYLMLSRDRDTDEILITGVRQVPDENDGDVNYLVNTRSNEEVEFGAKIRPLYLLEDVRTSSLANTEGKQITFSKKTALRMEALPEGRYLSSAVITDSRGDSYYSAVISSTLERGTMKDWGTEPNFYGRDY